MQNDRSLITAVLLRYLIMFYLQNVNYTKLTQSHCNKLRHHLVTNLLVQPEISLPTLWPPQHTNFSSGRRGCSLETQNTRPYSVYKTWWECPKGIICSFLPLYTTIVPSHWMRALKNDWFQVLKAIGGGGLVLHPTPLSWRLSEEQARSQCMLTCTPLLPYLNPFTVTVLQAPMMTPMHTTSARNGWQCKVWGIGVLPQILR
jgi:hypothetical protein